MSKKTFKSQASSSRAISGAFAPSVGGLGASSTFGAPTAFGSVATSILSYVYEPPDLSAIRDPSIVVALKNLQKKDSTTKAKALEDLQAHIASLAAKAEGVEEALLEAWIKLYPRTSIDNSRQTRQRAHTLQGQIATSCGRRIAKHLPSAAGAWLAGLTDNDKLVARSAHDAFTNLFPSEEKQRGVWKVYQAPILEYCRDAMLKETVQTLSDERTASPDDAEAKYYRVVGSAVLTVVKAFEVLSDEDIHKQTQLYSEILGSGKMWALASSPDAYVRRAIYKLLGMALKRSRRLLDFGMISTHLIQEALHVDQSGSVSDFVSTLAQLTEVEPNVWTSYYTGTGKKSASRRLAHFLRRGSAGGPRGFWVVLSALLQRLPSSILTSDGSDASAAAVTPTFPVLTALHEGVSGKDELRAGNLQAWETYLALVDRLKSSIITPEARRLFAQKSVIPLLQQYVKPSLEGTTWTVAGVDQQEIWVKVLKLLLEISPDAMKSFQDAASNMLIEDLQTSYPEQSKDYVKSQDNVIAEFRRWYGLQALATTSGAISPVYEFSGQNASIEARTAMRVLKTRNGKPYSAAAALDLAVRTIPKAILEQSEIKPELLDFAEVQAPLLMTSASSAYLVRLLDALSCFEEAQGTYATCLQALVNAPASEGQIKALRGFLSSPWPKDSKLSSILTQITKKSVQEVLQGNDESWQLINASIENQSTPSDLIDYMLASMTKALSIQEQVLFGLRGLQTLVTHNGQALQKHITSSDGSSLLSRLLFLSQSGEQEEVRQQATKLNNAANAMLAGAGYLKVATDSMLAIIHEGIIDTSKTALPTEALISQASTMLRRASEEDLAATIQRLLPSSDQWDLAMKPFLDRIPDHSLAMMNPLGGAIYMVEQSSDGRASASTLISYDSKGRSSAVRLVQYVIEVLKLQRVAHTATIEQLAALFQYLAVLSQIATDELSISNKTMLWKLFEDSVDPDYVTFVAGVQALLHSWTASTSLGERDFVSLALKNLLAAATGCSIRSYYSARAYGAMAIEFRELKGHLTEDRDATKLKKIRKSPDQLQAVALVVGSAGHPGLSRLCNELIADLTGRDFREEQREAFRQLVLLNSVLQEDAFDISIVPQQRLVFYVKHVVDSLPVADNHQALVAQIFRSLKRTLPLIQEIYGSFWEALLRALSICFTKRESSVPELYAALSLLNMLHSMSKDEDTNDDLKDCLTERKNQISSELLRLMIAQADLVNSNNQPRQILNELLGRHLFIEEVADEDLLALYPVVACDSGSLQQTAYRILHKAIPNRQEEVSLDAALTKDYVAKLPDELLSLVLEIPDQYQSLGDEPSLPPALMRYLLSWKLVFDHWTGASYKIQHDYVECIKQEGTDLRDLLNYTFEFLIHNRPRPVNPSKYNIEDYKTGAEETPETEAQHLLAHLYYLCLKHLPTLSKAWWRDDCPRYLQKPVEEWTEKYISPLVIQAELSATLAWVPTQDPEAPLEIKVSLRSREVTASYPIDDQVTSIRIALPPTYPLAPIGVEDVHRVAVDERKWRAWLITTQGVMNFASSSGGIGAVIDGLVTWRKNVTGALKGQSECAICYSIVSADRQLPSKKCGTCKNAFHGSCLFKWFRSSGSSSCPLCRNAFNYG